MGGWIHVAEGYKRLKRATVFCDIITSVSVVTKGSLFDRAQRSNILMFLDYAIKH